VSAFWAIGLGFRVHSLFSVSECWAIELDFISFHFSLIFSFLMLTAAKNICINVFIIINY
jgi:hypothetical protein